MPARKALSTARLYPALRTRRERVTFLDQPGMHDGVVSKEVGKNTDRTFNKRGMPQKSGNERRLTGAVTL